MMAQSFGVCDLPVRSAKFVARKQWVVAGLMTHDMLMKLWDWDKGWVCAQIFEGHTHYVMQVMFNPKDTSASLDRTIKIWNLGSPDPNFTLEAHSKGVNCIDCFTGGDKPFLITGYILMTTALSYTNFFVASFNTFCASRFGIIKLKAVSRRSKDTHIMYLPFAFIQNFPL
ncbi:hypothetical protein Droror1_Dr00009954 [Drosera rotundifolia]